MDWTWDPEKDRINQAKHRISFSAAQLVFHDLNLVTEEDDYPHEQRWRTTGRTLQVLITVIHTWPTRQAEPGRIISARKASRRERRTYEEGYGQTY